VKGHIRERSPGHWAIVLDTRDPATGKRRVKWHSFTGSKRGAQVECARLVAAMRGGAYVEPTKLTLSAWLTQWLATVRQEVSPKTHERYGELVRNYLIPALGSMILSKLTPVAIQAVFNDWATGGRRDGKSGGLAPRTRHHLHRLLKSALARAVDDQVLARNPLERKPGKGKRLPKVEPPPMVVLTPEQSTMLLDGLRHTRVYWPTLIALATGMRRGEILALRWNGVDFERRLVRVTESLEETRPEPGRAKLRFKSPKSGKARVITLPAFAVEGLRRHKREQAEQLLALGVRQSGETLVCPREDGEAMVPESLTHEFTRLVGRVKGLPRVTFHGLRHTHASHLLKAKEHPKVVQERLGHSTIAITMDLYSHLMDGMETAAAAKIDEAFAAVKPIR
jgi:integrase